MAFTFKHGDRPLEGYVIQRGVGTGGFGEVYYAVSDGGREVALKYLRDNPAVELRGVSHCMNLKSPHLVTIFDVRQNADGDYFIIMEYVQGPSLRDLLIAEPDGLGPQKAAFFIRELAKGLGYLHERGIVHRDMKPGNIFYEDGYVKIGDYGLSKFISVSRHSAQTASIGTVHYMAPEIGSGHYHRGIDLYALGVILYEMLLGRVPYDGATLGEVLMKHLTAQPEVEALPEPFAQVIRKALQKNPKERYQTVDEMAEAILDVSEVQNSLAGFNPQSLTVVARGGRDGLKTPSPSPNPSPPAGVGGIRIGRQGAGGAVRAHVFRGEGPAAELTGSLARRAQRVGDKVARKMHQLERKHGPRRPARRSLGAGQSPVRDRGRFRHRVLAILLVAGIAAGLGTVVGLTTQRGEFAGSAVLGVLLMSAGVVASRRATYWLGQAGHPLWVQRGVTLGCCAPLLAVALAPMMSSGVSPGVLLALLLTALLVDWEKRFEYGASGEMKLGQAFMAGLCAFVLTKIFAKPHELPLVIGGIAAATSLAVQGVAWFVPPPGFRARGRPPQSDRDSTESGAAPAGSLAQTRTHRMGERLGQIRRRVSGAFSPVGPPRYEPAAEGEVASIPPAVPVEQDSLHARLASAEPLPPSRHSITRAVWSVAGFGLLAGAVVSFLSTVLVSGLSVDDRQAVLTICVACCCMLVFALRKTTLRRRPTFWRETLRPFLLSLAAFGIGAPIVALAVQPRLDDGLQVVLVSAIVLCGVLFLILLIARGRRPVYAQAPFWVGSGESSRAPQVSESGGESPTPVGEPARSHENGHVHAP